MSTPVIFRYDSFGVLALFPTLINSQDIGECVAYAHVGQHMGVDYDAEIYISRPATENEYKDLLAEVSGIYDDLKVYHRNRSSEWLEIRRKDIKKFYGGIK